MNEYFYTRYDTLSENELVMTNIAYFSFNTYPW